MAGRAAQGNQAMGYWRGLPLAGGSGSGMGQANTGAGVLGQGFGSGMAGDWHPTVIYMLLLIVAEMVVFGFIGKLLK